MGVFLSRFRSKPTRIERLEKVEKEARAIQEFKRHNQQKLKHYIGTLLLYSIVIYVICAIFCYIFYFPDSWSDRFLYLLPFVAFPFLIYGLKRFLHWYYVRRITEKEFRLVELREEKRQLLEEVMEKETYKTAKEILDKFDPERAKKMMAAEHKNDVSHNTPVGQVLYGSPTLYTPYAYGTQPGYMDLRHRQAFRPVAATPPSGYSAPGGSAAGGRPGTSRVTPQQRNGSSGSGRGAPPGPPTPRPILPLHRSNVDKLVEYLVGDGPAQRYALICFKCSSHNGMALKEEFEYLAFRCAYCYAYNPARKQRPNAPRIQQLSIDAHESSSSSSSDTGSDIDEEEERRKLQETPDGGAKEEKEGEENKETTKAAKDEASRDAPVAAGNDTSDVAKPMAPTTPTGGTMKSEQVAAPVVENAS